MSSMSDYNSVMDRIAQRGKDRDKIVNDYFDRQQFLSDVASQRAFSETAAGKASERRMKEAAEIDRLRLVERLNEMGVPGVTSDTSMEDAGAALRGFNQNRAVAGAEIIQAQMDAADIKQQAAMNAVLDVAKDKGSAEQMKEALKATLADSAASKFIPEAARAKMVNVLMTATTTKQIEDAVNSVVERMQGDHFTPLSFLPGVYGKDRAYNQAQAFFTKFDTEVKSRVDVTKQAAFAVRMKSYDDTNRDALALTTKLADHLYQNGSNLPTDMRKGIISRIGPPKNPADVLPGKSVSGPPVPTEFNDLTKRSVANQTAPLTDPGPSPMLPAPAPSVAGTPDTPMPQFGGMGGSMPAYTPAMRPSLDLSKGAAWLRDNVSDFLPRAPGEAGLGLSSNRVFPSPADLANLRTKAGDALLSADEVIRLKKVALDRGMTADQANAHEQALKAGDPTEVAKFKQGIRMLRSGAFGDLPPGAGGGDQATAPPMPQ